MFYTKTNSKLRRRPPSMEWVRLWSKNTKQSSKNWSKTSIARTSWSNHS